MSLATMHARLQNLGGGQLARVNKQKLYSLQQGYKVSYNSRNIILPDETTAQCLINKNRVNADEDSKFISIEFDYNLQPGDVFHIIDDNTSWLVYMQQHTETAYFRAEILRSRYQAKIGEETHWVYFKGPTESDASFSEEYQTRIYQPNVGGTMFIKDTPNNREALQRFSVITVGEKPWEIQVVDAFSVPGIIEVELKEYFVNSMEEYSPAMEAEKVVPSEIEGEQFVFPYDMLEYNVAAKGSFSIEDKTAKILSQTYDEETQATICKVEVVTSKTGSFTLNFREEETSQLTVLFVKIKSL